MIGRLLQIRLTSFLRGLGGRGKNGEYKPMSVGKTILYIILFGYVALVFAGISGGFALAMVPTALSMGMEWLFFGFYAAIIFTVIFFLSIFETKSNLFECKDNDLLLALPICPRDIVISRIIGVLIVNYAQAAIFQLPALAVYLIFGGSVWHGVFFCYSFLLIPVLATALASGVGYLVARLTAKLRNKSFAGVLFSLLFLGVYFYAYFNIIGSSEDLFEDEAAMQNLILTLSEALPVLRGIGEAVMGTLIPTLIFTVATVAVCTVVFYRICQSFIRVATENRGVKRVEYKEKKVKRNSAFGAIVKKEFGRFLSSSNYILNSGSGTIFVLLCAVMLCLKKGDIDNLFAEIGMEFDVFPIFCAIIVCLSCFNNISASALSLEGSSLWLIRSLPVDAKTVLLAKTVPHIVISGGLSMLLSLVICVMYRAPFGMCLLLLLLPLLANVLCALFGIALNVAFPKFSYVNEAEVVKQSMACFLSIFGQMFLGILLGVAPVILTFFGLGVWGLLLDLVVLIVGILGSYALIKYPCCRKYNTL